MKKDNNNEPLPIVNEQGTVIGCATRGECHSGSKLLHPVVHLHLFDRQGRLYLQKRPQWKEIQPGKWDTAVGGHVDFGEEIKDALRREASEEVGISDFEPELIDVYIFESEKEKELVYTFSAVVEPQAIHPSDEIDGGRWWFPSEIHDNRSLMTPNLLSELPKIGI